MPPIDNNTIMVMVAIAAGFFAWRMGWLTTNKKPAASKPGLPPAPAAAPSYAMMPEPNPAPAPQTIDAMKAQVADLLDRIELEDARKAKVEAVASGGISALKEYKKAVLMP